MLLIGFMWLFVGMAAAATVKYVIPTRWDDSGPVAIVVAAAGAFFASFPVIIYYEGINGYGPPTTSGTASSTSTCGASWSPARSSAPT